MHGTQYVWDREHQSLPCSSNNTVLTRLWLQELCIYNFAKPGTTPQAGHFTQVRTLMSSVSRAL